MISGHICRTSADWTRRDLTSIVAEATEAGQIIGVRIPSTDEDDEPWTAPSIPTTQRAQD